MESQEFNLSVLENVTTFSTPLKDCSQYDAILSLIKEEIDIEQTEDEAEANPKSAKKLRLNGNRKDSESCDSEGKFKSPYNRDFRVRSKSPRNILVPQIKRRSYENEKSEKSNKTHQRVRSLGRIMPGRSFQPTGRNRRSSVSHSDTSGFSDQGEIPEMRNGENRLLVENFDDDIKVEIETEETALEELLAMAQQQVINDNARGDKTPERPFPSIRRKHRSSASHSDTSGFSDSAGTDKALNIKKRIPKKKFEDGVKKDHERTEKELENLVIDQEHVTVRGRPHDENSTVSSQGESTSLTTDPLDTGALEDSYVENSQSPTITDLRQKLLNHRNSLGNKPKTAEMIKKNLHFDTPDSEEDSHNFSLTLSPEPSARFNGDRAISSSPPVSEINKLSQDSTTSSLKISTQELQRIDLESDASTVLQSSGEQKTSENIIGNAQKDLTQESSNSDSKTKTTAILSSPDKRKTIKTSTVCSPKNSTQQVTNLDLANGTSTKLPRPRKTSLASTVSSQESLVEETNNLKLPKEASLTPPRPRKKKKRENSIASSSQDSSNLDPAEDASTTLPHPRKRTISQTSTSSTHKNLTQDLSNVDSAEETQRPKKKKKRANSMAGSLKNLSQNLNDADPKRDSSATPPRPKKKKTSQKTISDPLQNDSDFNIETGPEVPSSAIKKSSQEIVSSLLKELSNLEHTREASATPPRPTKKKDNEKIESDPLQEITNLDSNVEASAAARNSENNQRNSEIVSSPLKESPNLDHEREASVTPPRPRKKICRKLESDPLEEIADFDSNAESNAVAQSSGSKIVTEAIISNPPKESVNLDRKTEASETPRKKKIKQTIISEPTQEGSDLNSITEASTCNEKVIRNIISDSIEKSSNLNLKKGASPTPIRPKKQKKKPKIKSVPLEDTADSDFDIETSTSARTAENEKANREIFSSPQKESSNVADKREVSVTPERPRKRKRSLTSPLRGLTQELENCMTNNDFEQICKDIENDMETPSFTFETVQMLDEYEGCDQQANNKILSKILSSPVSKTDEQSPMSIEHIGSSDELYDYDPLYIAEAKNNYDATPSTSKRKKSTVSKKKQSTTRKTMTDTDDESNRRSSEVDSLEKNEKKSIDDVVKKRRSSLRLEGKKRVNMNILDSEDENNESGSNADEEYNGNTSSSKNSKSANGKRRSTTRSRRKRVTMTISDLEDEGNLTDEAAHIAKKVKVAQKQDRLDIDTLNKLDKIVVKLRHNVPRQHKIGRWAGTTPLTYEDQMEFLEYESLNKDTYSPAEDEIIRQNWENFCEDHDWDPENYKPFLLFKHGRNFIMSCLEERRKFVQYLAYGLLNRPLFSVYSRFKTLFNRYTDSGARYTLEEDKKILAYIRHNPEKHKDCKYAELAKVMKRSRVSIWRRYHILEAKEKQKKLKKKVLNKVTWDLDLVTEFVTRLLDITISEELMELKDAFIPKVVWEKLESKMGISYDFLRRSWDCQFHMQFFSPEPISSNATKIRLIENMWMEGIKNTTDIEWYIVAKYFDGCTTSFLRRTFNHLTAQASAALDSHDFSDILEWLHESKINQLRLQKKDKYLPRLYYENKEVKFVPEDLTRITSTSKSASAD